MESPQTCILHPAASLCSLHLRVITTREVVAVGVEKEAIEMRTEEVEVLEVEESKIERGKMHTSRGMVVYQA